MRGKGLFILNWYHTVAHNCHGKTKNLAPKTKYIMAKPKTSWQKQKYLTAKTKYLTAKPKTSQQNQILHSKGKIALVLLWLFAFAVKYLVLRWGILSWGILILLWGFWFCREVFCFCREVFGFAVTVVGHRMVPIKYEKSFVPRHIKSDEGLFWKSRGLPF